MDSVKHICNPFKVNFTHTTLSLQARACIVNQDNKIVGVGYNCMLDGCDNPANEDLYGENTHTRSFLFPPALFRLNVLFQDFKKIGLSKAL